MFKGKANKSVRSSNYLGGIPRTKDHNHYEWRSTFNAGYLVPFFMREVDPATNLSETLGELVRSITPLGPVMDRSFLDLFWFFVPNRLLWDHWEEFIAGYNKEAWTQDVVYTVPKIIFDASEYGEANADVSPDSFVHSFIDYCGGICDIKALAHHLTLKNKSSYSFTNDQINDLHGFSALFPRAYVKVWNDWFRDENLQDELQIYTGDNDEEASAFAFDLTDAVALPKAAKYHNRFTSALPQPQKGPDVLIPMENLQIFNSTGGRTIELFGETSEEPHSLKAAAGGAVSWGSSGSGTAEYLGLETLNVKNVSNTIRQLRLATQTELLLARDARGGTRYVESLLSHWSVHNGDARLQRSEYLGSKQIPLSVTQVVNTAESASGSLGNVGAISVTKDNSHYFSKGFTEHGILMCVGVVRTNISYSTGIRKQFQRFNRFDYIWPEFRHLGDVALYTKEADAYDLLQHRLTGDVYHKDHVFGYTPYASEIREGYSFNNGLFRKGLTGSLSYLTYQEEFGQNRSNTKIGPTLSGEYIEQPTDIVYNTLIDQSGPQYYGLFVLEEDIVYPLDPTSDPGLMDHF